MPINLPLTSFQLFNNKIEINSVDLEGVTSNINRDSVSVFNFDYIIKAFSPDNQDPDTTPMTFSLENINLDTINLRYTDAFFNRLFRQTKAPRKPHQNF
jgi:uncharacterized protein involved in outer membrane biogenesis